MIRTWSEIGKDVDGIQAIEVAAEIDRLEWHQIVGTLNLPACPGLAIKQCIRELRIPKVTAIAYNGVVRDRAGHLYSLLGIEGNYRNGRARVYVLDLGSVLTPMCSDFYEKEGADA